MTLSFNKLNEIAELYESIAFSEQEQLNGEYIDEQGRPGSAAVRNQNVFKFPTSSAGTRRGAAAGTRTPTPTFQNTGGFGRYAPPSAQVKTPAPAPAAKPTAPTPAPKATTPAKPATPAPTSTSAKTSPTSTSTLKSATDAASKPSAFNPAPKSTLKSATDAASKPSAFNPAPAPAPTAAPVVAKPAPKPAAPGAGRDYLMKRQLNQNFDVFDAVLGHLIDEGYADTEEAATAIMANMSEDWRESIVEEVFGEDKKYDANRKRAAQRAAARNAARDAGKTGAVPGVGYVTPRRESETYRDSAGVERHKSGAKNA
jgi:hypothetical protein